MCVSERVSDADVHEADGITILALYYNLQIVC